MVTTEKALRRPSWFGWMVTPRAISMGISISQGSEAQLTFCGVALDLSDFDWWLIKSLPRSKSKSTHVLNPTINNFELRVLVGCS